MRYLGLKEGRLPLSGGGLRCVQPLGLQGQGRGLRGLTANEELDIMIAQGAGTEQIREKAMSPWA